MIQIVVRPLSDNKWVKAVYYFDIVKPFKNRVE